jgi:hypothetical protein
VIGDGFAARRGRSKQRPYETAQYNPASAKLNLTHQISDFSVATLGNDQLLVDQA